MFLMPSHPGFGYLPPTNPIVQTQTVRGLDLTDSQIGGTQFFRVFVNRTIWSIRYIDPRILVPGPTKFERVLWKYMSVPVHPGQFLNATGTIPYPGVPIMDASSIIIIGGVVSTPPYPVYRFPMPMPES